MLIGWSFKKTVAETTVFCEIMNLQIQGNNLILSERRVTESEKNSPHALSKADKEFLWSSGNILEMVIIHGILVCLSLMIIA